MGKTARGGFDVTMTPAAEDESAEGITLGQVTLSKKFRGDLQGTSRGWMLTAITPVEGSAGYVALERVEAVIEGRHGSFVLQHFGIMSQDSQQLTLKVVPDSATRQLKGLRGSMSIRVVEKEHAYEFEYELPDAPIAL
jgi:hypothetical protein